MRFLDFFDDIWPHDKPKNILPPSSIPLQDTLTITGRVFDQTTTGLGGGLTVYAYLVDDAGQLVLKKKVPCQRDGNYFILFRGPEIDDLDLPGTIELAVYQGKELLDLTGSGVVDLDNTKCRYLANLFVSKRPSIKGVVIRKNDVHAAGCLVELYDESDTAGNEPVESAFTNLKGEYKIPYSSKLRNALRLKFYNNEEIETSAIAQVSLGVSPTVEPDITETVTDIPEVGILLEDTTKGEVYEVVTVNGSQITKRLVSSTDEPDDSTKNYWVYLKGTDDKNYKVLNRRFVVSADGKFRDCYVRVSSGSFSQSNSVLHNKVTETYQATVSPQIVTANLEDTVNFKFTNNTLDTYTRLINREEELVPSSKTDQSEGIVLVRSMLEGYDTENIPYVASLIGATEEDVQDLSQARDFNSQFKLNDEDLLFALQQKGLKLDIASFFSISNKALLTKVENAVIDNIIPAQSNLTGRLDAIKSRLIEVISKEFEPIFDGISDTTVESVKNNAAKKAEFVSCMVAHSYDNKRLDNNFWAALTLSANEEKQLKRVVQYSEVCDSNNDFINLFVESGTLKAFGELLKLTEAQLRTLIQNNLSVLDFEDLSEELKNVDAYTAYILQKIETLFPTESLLVRIANTNFSIANNAALSTKVNALRLKLISDEMAGSTTFYDIMDGTVLPFNIEKGPVRDYLEIDEVNSVLATFYSNLGSYSKADWIWFLTLIQRVYSVTKEGKFETFKALLEKGFHSAYDIVKVGKTIFSEKMNPLLPDNKVSYIYKASEYKVNKALALLNKYSSQSNNAMPAMVKAKKPVNEAGKGVQLLTLPELEVLFGDQDLTDTKHGESVLGPAAYLVDVLNVLKQYKVNGTETLYDKLIERRPDIAQIPLNCTNALTPLPYIDLVMEILENEIYDADGLSGENTLKWDTTKTEEQLKTDPEYKLYQVYYKIKTSSVGSWLRQSFDMFSEEVKLFCKTIGINRAKLAEPFSKSDENAANPYFDALGLTSKEQVLFPDKTVSTSAALDFTTNAITLDSASTQKRMLVKEFLNDAVMSLDEFNALIDSYFVNPVVDGHRFTVHYHGKQELGTAYLEFGADVQRCNAFVMRMFQFRRLMMVTGWSLSTLDAVILSQGGYSAYFNTSTENNNLITFATVEHIGKAKMNQEYLDLSEDQVAGIYGKAAILEYNETISFSNKIFSENTLAEEHKATLQDWIAKGDESGKPVGELVFSSEGEPHPFFEYLQDAMALDTDELTALSLILETTAGKPVLTSTGIQNMISAWQLAGGYNIGLEELVDYCLLIQFEATQPLVQSIDALNEAQKTVIAHQTDVKELLFLLYHKATEEKLTKFNDKANTIAKNIFDKKDEIDPTDPNRSDLISAFIKEQLQLNTDLAAAFVDKAIAEQTISAKNMVNFVIDTASASEFEKEDAINLLSPAIKQSLKGLSLCEEMGIEEADLANISESQLQVFSLPIAENQTVTFEFFNNFASICQAGKYLKEGQNRFQFFNFIKTNVKVATYSNLEPFINWYGILTDWQHNEELDPSNNSYLNKNLKWFLHAGEVNSFMTRYGIDSSEAIKWIKWDWTNETEAKTCVENMASIAQSKANSGVYEAEMKEGRDQLRSKQRDALVQYLFEIDSSRFDDVNDLFSYFLIDTQMTPAVASSRILQATLAVQSFIQRIQLGLETGISLSKKDSKKWEWMSLYRVWEANRKIFLYPENWLEPELRDNKSPFFKELEKELTGKEITKESVESSYIDYVSKLEKVGNIEICQMYNEEVENFNVLHVVGRTRFEPREYYYRKLVNESYWTPWEKMSVEINSDHIAPVIIKDRLVTFWLECTSVAKEPTNEDLTVDPDTDQDIKSKKAQKQLQLQICWSEYIDKKWSGKQSCDQKVLIDDANMEDKEELRLVFDDENKRLHILCDPKADKNANNGYSFSVECFNHVQLTKLNYFRGKAYLMPTGMSTSGQKAESIKGKAWLSLPVAGANGIAYANDIVENIKGETSLIYPHQYKEFMCNSPFVVETNMQSVVFVPTLNVQKSSTILRKVIKHVYRITKFRPARVYYRAVRRNNYKRYQKYNANRLMDDRYEYRMPEYFTYDHKDYSVIKETPTKRPITFEKVVYTPVFKEVVWFKPEMTANLGYHPYMETLRANMEKYGIDGILDPIGVEDENHKLLPQQANKDYLTDFELNHEVVKNVVEDENTAYNLKYIQEKFEYGLKGAYSLYNWELFFHLPFLLANRFLIEGNFAEALKWIHYIFDPRETEGEAPGKYWKFKPFAEANATVGIDDLLYDLNMNGDEDPENVELNKQIEIWSNDPFKPHNIAQMRPSAYMKAVIMRYLDIIIAYGDDLFRIDTTESINEAMQYYMIAAQLLGGKPEVVETNILEPKSYNDMESDGMGNAIEYFEEALIKPENAAYLEKHIESNELEVASKPFSKDKDLKGMVTSVYGAIDNGGEVSKLYFGIPKNEKMLVYWDRVADRLFKIRNSLNIDGIKRTVALFAPPIDPGMLIRARKAGVSIGEIMRQADGNDTQYKFQTLLQKAMEICNEVKSLGSQLLSALEKGDNEKISKLRAGHEKTLTEMVTAIKEKGVEEAEENIEQLKQQKDHIKFRENYYRKKKKISGKEQQQLNFMDEGMKLQVASQALQLAASSASFLPDVQAGANGFGGSPLFSIKWGGEKLSRGIAILSSSLSVLSSISNHKGSKAGILAGYKRRKEEWNFQADVAKRELAQLEKQEITAEIRKELAKLDQRNHLKQVEQSQESYDVLTSKFTNQELYLWMANEMTALYRSAYDMAYKMAKKAESAYNYELNLDTTKSFILNDHFNAQTKGLLAGEKLYMDLKKMEMEYLTDNTRRFELTKHVSLALLDPQKILDLRSGPVEGGINGATCEFTIPEILFDMDHPGHKNRRIKSVSLTIPCVTGSYTSISAELTLDGNRAKVTKMATSSAVNDNGMFELNFNDARYLPFEGADVESTWRLNLPNNIRQFDYNSITDVIMHINYTAEDGGNRTQVESELAGKLNEMVSGNVLASMFSIKAQYPEAWAKIGTEEVSIEIKKSQLPFFLQGQNLNVSATEATVISGEEQTPQAVTASTGNMGVVHTVTIPADANVSGADDLMIVMKYTVS